MADIYTKEIYKTSAGWGYKILRNGIAENDQPHAPGLPGLVPMTEIEANTYADSVMNLKINPPIPPTTITFYTKLTDVELTKVKTELNKLGYGYEVDKIK